MPSQGVGSTTEALRDVFEERAEHLDPESLKRFTLITTHDRRCIGQLKGPGAKLLIGPRGSGKSTLLRTAYFELAVSTEVLGVYVNFSDSLALEPLFRRHANATDIFRQWVVQKIILGIKEAYLVRDATIPPALVAISQQAQAFLREVETGQPASAEFQFIAPSALQELISRHTLSLGLARCVLLLDDAAHAFSREQQVEFFEIFRTLRSKGIAPKAAVYPGVTEYSPNFNVGHEAQPIFAWYDPTDRTFLSDMRRLLERRLPPDVLAKFEGKTALIDYLALASFGMPRALLTMVADATEADTADAKQLVTRDDCSKAIQLQADFVLGLFKALKSKLPRFKHFLDLGLKLTSTAEQRIKEYNKLQTVNRKAYEIAIQQPLGAEISRILEFLEYAGVIRKTDQVSRGIKGVFQRYAVHNSLLFKDGAYSLGKTFAVSELVEAASRPSKHAFVRTSDVRLLGKGYKGKCRLALESCRKCGASRPTETARFCVACGSELADASLYVQLLATRLEELPLTPKKVNGIKSHFGIATVKELLLRSEGPGLLEVHGVGPVWASRIRNAVMEFVSV